MKARFLTSTAFEFARDSRRGLALLLIAVVGAAQNSSTVIEVAISPATGGGNPIRLSVNGVEHEPRPLIPRWNDSTACLSNVESFAQSWLSANNKGELDWRFAHLCSSFDPLCKGLKDFSRMCIQSGVAENLFLPGGLSQISKNILEGNRGLAGVPGPRNS